MKTITYNEEIYCGENMSRRPATKRQQYYWDSDIVGWGGPIGIKYRERTRRGTVRPKSKGRY